MSYLELKRQGTETRKILNNIHNEAVDKEKEYKTYMAEYILKIVKEKVKTVDLINYSRYNIIVDTSELVKNGITDESEPGYTRKISQYFYISYILK